MRPKKRWRYSNETESQELVTRISWNTSSSEESEDEGNNPKICKPCFPNFEYDMKLRAIIPIKTTKTCARKTEGLLKVDSTESIDISTFKSEENVIDLEKRSSLESKSIFACSPEFDLPIMTENSIGKKVLPNYSEPINISTYTSEEVCFGSESPILEPKSIFAGPQKSNSPIISQNHLFRETSPVITNREIIKKIRNKRKEFINRSTKIDGSSPDIFLTQSSKIIEENESPDRVVMTPINFSQDIGSIELVSSQDSSSITIVNPTTSESSIQTSDLSDQCYHQPSPRRKNCRRNGLFYQLQKSLNLQKSRLSLWHHDIFCKNLIPSELEHIKGKIINKWKDFGCTILKCTKVILDRCELENIFLISLGCNTDANFVYSSGQIIKIFFPFKVQLVQYENKEVNMYYNITKILTESATYGGQVENNNCV